MEKWDTRLFQQDAATMGHDQGWNIVELESRRDLRQKIDEYIHCTRYYTMSSAELRDALSLLQKHYGLRFITLLVRALSTKDAEKRQAVVQLLVLLQAPEAIPQLQSLIQAEHLPRSLRLSASLALAGMGATPETQKKTKLLRTYAIS